jgi:hypothetical protein
MDLIFHCLFLSVLAKHVTYMNLGMHDLRGKRFFGGDLRAEKLGRENFAWAEKRAVVKSRFP